ncbi:DUF3560 domain-containing protein [Leifsonia shinshuensis]
MLTITHTHEAGTLIDGTSRGDGSAELLKANGWKWGRSISSWYVPFSRDRLPKTHVIERTAAALRTAGFEVDVDVDMTHRPTAEVEADKAVRAEDRAAALDAKADRKATAAEQAWDREEAASRALPEGGEPIHVGHHSETKHRRAIERAHQRMGQAIQATDDAARARARADVAAAATDRRYAPAVVANRIEKLAADIRGHLRQLEGHIANRGTVYAEQIPPASGAYRDRLTAELDELVDQHDYWQAVRAEQIEAGTATNYSRETINKGDHVRVGRSWYEVARVNAKSVSVYTITGAGGHRFTNTTPYAHIKEVRPAGA